jgi:hypothetical protein
MIAQIKKNKATGSHMTVTVTGLMCEKNSKKSDSNNRTDSSALLTGKWFAILNTPSIKQVV